MGKRTKTGITFQDVQGMEEVKEQLIDVVNFFKYPERYKRMGAKPPKGILLLGPPGTGKTLIARAIAGEASISFISVSGSELEDKYVGVGAEKVRNLFQWARENAPCIIFIDEIDVIAHRRKNSAIGGTDLTVLTTNQLLTELDGFDPQNTQILVIGATNRPNVLDPAITRPGRLGRKIETSYPVITERVKTFRYYGSKLKVDREVNYDSLAKQTSFFSYADIEQICNNAALIAIKKDHRYITQRDFREAIDEHIGGIARKTKKYRESEKMKIAIHEVGHAVVSFACKRPLVKLTIIPRLGDKVLGFAQYHQDDEKQTESKQDLENEICGALGGRVAEEHYSGEIGTGAQNDLEKCTKIAYAMVRDYGMSEKVGNLCYYDSNNPDYRQKDYSPHLARIIDEEVQRIIQEQYQRAKLILEQYDSAYKRVLKALLKNEELSGDEFMALMEANPTLEASSNKTGEAATS